MTNAALDFASAPRGGAVQMGIVLAFGLAVLALLSLGVGARLTSPWMVVEAILRPDPTSFDHRIITTLRLTRLEVALVAGATLGMSGALLQSLLRNPLAEPGLLGLNAGAALTVVLATAFVGTGLFEGWGRPWVAAFGAALVFALVAGISSAGRLGPTPLKVILAGVAIGALAGSLTDAALLLDERALQSLRGWLSGSLAGRSGEDVLMALPAAGLGAALALSQARPLDALALGERQAAGLGVAVGWTRGLTLLAAALLAGAAVAVAGPVGFVGLVTPHLVRRWAPPRMAPLLILSALAGAAILIAADIAARLVIAPEELPAGIVMLAIGAPVFVAFVARRLA